MDRMQTISQLLARVDGALEDCATTEASRPPSGGSERPRTIQQQLPPTGQIESSRRLPKVGGPSTEAEGQGTQAGQATFLSSQINGGGCLVRACLARPPHHITTSSSMTCVTPSPPDARRHPLLGNARATSSDSHCRATLARTVAPTLSGTGATSPSLLHGARPRSRWCVPSDACPALDAPLCVCASAAMPRCGADTDCDPIVQLAGGLVCTLTRRAYIHATHTCILAPLCAVGVRHGCVHRPDEHARAAGR